jgi:hypothetical protein
LQRGGYHALHLVHAARQRRYVFPQVDKLGAERLALLPPPTLEGIEAPVGIVNSPISVVKALVDSPVALVEAVVEVIDSPVDQLHVRTSLRSQSDAYSCDRENQADEFFSCLA